MSSPRPRQSNEKGSLPTERSTYKQASKIRNSLPPSHKTHNQHLHTRMSALLSYFRSPPAPPRDPVLHAPVRFSSPLPTDPAVEALTRTEWLSDPPAPSSLTLRKLYLPNMTARGFAGVVEGVLSPLECRALIAGTEAISYEQATVTALGNQQIMDTGYRKSGRCTIDTPSMAAEVTRRWGARFWGSGGGAFPGSCTNPRFSRRIRHLLPTADELSWTSGGERGLWDLQGINGRFRCLRYEKGDFFKRHRDGSYTERDERGAAYRAQSFVTMMLYLNSGGADFQGGGTSFFNARGDGFTTAPRAGSVLLFEHFLEHQGDELLGGVKYAIRSDVMYKRDGDREGKGGGRG